MEAPEEVGGAGAQALDSTLSPRPGDLGKQVC